MKIHELYTYRVFWSNEDEAYIGVCAEFPSTSHIDDTQVEAFKGIIELIRDTVDEMQKAGEEIPEALSCRHYSGNITFRTTPDKHREIAILAAENHISMNRYLNGKLAG